MKCRVQLTHVVTLVVEGESENQIQDWLNVTTPEEAFLLACDNGGKPATAYNEEIICSVGENSRVDYVIEED